MCVGRSALLQAAAHTFRVVHEGSIDIKLDLVLVTMLRQRTPFVVARMLGLVAS